MSIGATLDAGMCMWSLVAMTMAIMLIKADMPAAVFEGL